jgi:hypothetical protein
MNPIIFVFGSLSAIAVGFVTFVLMDPIASLPGMAEHQNGVPVRIAAGFLATLVGVVLGAVYRELRRRQSRGATRIAVGPFFRDMRGSIELWLGLVGSPMVFALLLRSTEGVDLIGLVIMALENGFCCLIILNTLIEKHDKPESPPGGVEPQSQ